MDSLGKLRVSSYELRGKRVPLLGISLLVLGALLFLVSSTLKKDAGGSVPPASSAERIPPESTNRTEQTAIPTRGFVAPEDVALALDSVTSSDIEAPPGETAVAGIVNHHALAMPLLARFAVDLRKLRPDITRIVIISPDHFNGGPGISTHDRPYAVSGGTFKNDTTSTRELVRNGEVSYVPNLFLNEHGIGAVVPFLAHEFPDAVFVPLALRMDRPEALKTLQTVIEAFIGHSDTFVLISADMSHYLTDTEAKKHDKETLNWLNTCNETALRTATDANLDSGRSVSALCAAIRAKNMTPTFHETAHDISTAYGGDPKSTTSYITGFWMVKSRVTSQ